MKTPKEKYMNDPEYRARIDAENGIETEDVVKAEMAEASATA